MHSSEIDKIKSQYELSEKEFQEMYEQSRELIIGNRKPSQTTPTAIVTGGQPGAGKIGLVLKAKREAMMRDEDTVIIDSDAYRGLYKNSMEIAEKYPELYSEITDKATGRITNMLLQEIIDKGYNFIFEGTMGKINIIEMLMSAPRKFSVTAMLIATSREESLLSVFERYIVMIQNMGIGRYATINAHDVRYNGFTQVATQLESKGVEVEVYERSERIEDIAYPNLLYKTSAKNSQFSSVEQALIEGRKKSFERCKGEIQSRLQAINEDLHNLTANNPEFRAEVDKLNEILLQNIVKNIEER